MAVEIRLKRIGKRRSSYGVNFYGRKFKVTVTSTNDEVDHWINRRGLLGENREKDKSVFYFGVQWDSGSSEAAVVQICSSDRVLIFQIQKTKISDVEDCPTSLKDLLGDEDLKLIGVKNQFHRKKIQKFYPDLEIHCKFANAGEILGHWKRSRLKFLGKVIHFENPQNLTPMLEKSNWGKSILCNNLNPGYTSD